MCLINKELVQMSELNSRATFSLSPFLMLVSSAIRASVVCIDELLLF